jgi:hypothetical protein
LFRLLQILSTSYEYTHHATMSLDFYPPMIHEGDLTPDAFGPEVDELCKEIHDACKGFGTDEK